MPSAKRHRSLTRFSGRNSSRVFSGRSFKRASSIISILSVLFLAIGCCSPAVKNIAPEQNKSVYVCSGPKSKCYHLDSCCYAFKNCTGSIVKMSLDSAIVRYYPCKFCVIKESLYENKDSIKTIESKNKQSKVSSKKIIAPKRDFTSEPIK